MMKTLISLVFIALASLAAEAQTKSTSAADYNGTLQFAVSETNAAFPFVFTVVTKRFDHGKLISTETEIAERQAQGVERETKIFEREGKTLRSYSLMLGFGNHTYCSSNGVSWKGPQEFVCAGPDGSGLLELRIPRKAESVVYSVTEKSLNGQPVKIYRKYEMFLATQPNGKKSFEEELATINSRGFFISVVNEEGTLDPEAVTLHREQTWDFKTKIKPVVAPK
jgi:hypothetical protein